MYSYIHDEEARVVYRFPAMPRVTERNDTRGRLRGWKADMTITITRSDNWLEGNQWRYKTSDPVAQDFDQPYALEQVLSHFRMRYEPKGKVIDCAEYDRLHHQYDSEARVRKV